MYRFIVKLIVPIVFISFLGRAVLLRALLQSVARRLAATGVTLPSWAPFLKMPNMKTVVTSTVSHVGWVGGGFCIRQRWVSGCGRLTVRGWPLICWHVGGLRLDGDP